MSTGHKNTDRSAIRNPQSVLIIDDDPDDIEITRRVLLQSRDEIIVTAIEGGERAIQALQESSDLPSLILIDLKMYGMSGIDTLRQIRADDRLKHIPLVIVTNSTLESDMRDAYAFGADSFVHKSFDIDQFGKDIRAQLDAWLK